MRTGQLEFRSQEYLPLIPKVNLDMKSRKRFKPRKYCFCFIAKKSFLIKISVGGKVIPVAEPGY